MLDFKDHCQQMENGLNAALAKLRKDFEDYQETQNAKTDFFTKMKTVGKKSPLEGSSPKIALPKKDNYDSQGQKKSNAGKEAESPMSKMRSLNKLGGPNKKLSSAILKNENFQLMMKNLNRNRASPNEM